MNQQPNIKSTFPPIKVASSAMTPTRDTKAPPVKAGVTDARTFGRLARETFQEIHDQVEGERFEKAYEECGEDDDKGGGGERE